MRLLLIALLAAGIGCNALPDADYGEIYDLETRQPIEGAQLTAHRYGKSRTPVAPLTQRSGDAGKYRFETEKGVRISHVKAEAGGYYPGVAIHRGRLYLRPVPEGARPAQMVEYSVRLDTEEIGLRLRDGALVRAEDADLVVRVRRASTINKKVVLVRGRGGVRRIVSPMRHGIALEPFAAFDNIVEVPKERYTKKRTRGTMGYGWTAYGTYAVRTPNRQRYAKALVAGFLDEDGETARVVIRFRTSEPDAPRFVATTP